MTPHEVHNLQIVKLLSGSFSSTAYTDGRLAISSFDAALT
jgi:hypothetical protein